jgi:predicted Zn-dependent protease
MTAPTGTRVVVPVIKAVKKEAKQATPDPVIQKEIESQPALVEKTLDKAEPSSVKTEPVTLEGDALRADLDTELHRLHHLMSAFEATYEQLKQNETAPAPQKPSKKPAGTKSPPATPPAETPEAPLIEEIKSSKRKPKLVSPKVAEQGEIIDHFIKVAPTLPRTKPSEPSADLAAESVNYGDHIVSETLVEILLKQGKKAKAIEMLKKLIWKFPQKKAYFAAQIEALKS